MPNEEEVKLTLNDDLVVHYKDLKKILKFLFKTMSNPALDKLKKEQRSLEVEGYDFDKSIFVTGMAILTDLVKSLKLTPEVIKDLKDKYKNTDSKSEIKEKISKDSTISKLFSDVEKNIKRKESGKRKRKKQT